ncbi:MAG: TIGR03364 family FAD-dependent oxidoreductase [Planctomycetaceae bacterium]|nr:TIGR03364 family FAD-dependent oxidoreductase [Planctomycetaceae bacterium]
MGDSRFDLAVVGGGILGLTHAVTAAEQGFRVLLLERHAYAQGASIRNFGMVWPIGQPFCGPYDLARSSRERWIQVASRAGFLAEPCGSLFVAHHADEWQVLGEYQQVALDQGLELELLPPDQVQQRSPAVNPDSLQGGLFSPWEVRVNPRQAIPAITRYLQTLPGVEVLHGACVIRAGDGSVETADGRRWSARHILVCGGDELSLLYPHVLQNAGLRQTKLHMLRTTPQPVEFRIGPHLASGLTLRHYDSFANCPSLDAVKQRIARDQPELDQYGIHVMASQTEAGELILGDSHEYGPEIEIFHKQRIDDLILRELRKVFRFPNWELQQRWVGYYAKFPGGIVYRQTPEPGVELITGVGGNGMTLCWGLAAETLASLTN